ncbi:hypothetical protein N7488_008639 [Penicillium malachiteum]|nr:hypothetical protein N7488_008639 [Penicillium malachiteum]
MAGNKPTRLRKATESANYSSWPRFVGPVSARVFGPSAMTAKASPETGGTVQDSVESGVSNQQDSVIA